MEKINKTLRRLSGSEDFQRRYEDKKRETLNHPDVKEFIKDHRNELTDEMLEKGLIKLYEFSTQSKECNQCSSLEDCINVMKGYHPQLVIQRGTINIHYDMCPRKIMHDEKRRNEKLIQSMYVPRDILEASFNSIYPDGERLVATKKAATFIENYLEGTRQKGIYFYGKFGVGKSYYLGAIANELAFNKIPSMIVYVPELFRELKNSIADSTLNEKIERIKKVPVLMFDDIGAEAMSSWTRDEVLGPILQFRMLESLPTFFTSNFDFKELEHHLTYSQKGEEEKMKARRVMERIKYLSEPVLVNGPNRRN